MIASKLWSPYLHGPIGLLIALMLLTGTPAASAQTVRAREDIGRVLSLAKVHNVNGVVSGEVHNHSSNTLRDVQLFIRYTRLWGNEMKPGAVDPGTSTYDILPKEIPPGGRAPFTFKPSPLPNVATEVIALAK